MPFGFLFLIILFNILSYIVPFPVSKNTGSKSGSKIIKTEIELTASVQHGVKKKQQLPESSQTQVNRKLVASNRV